MTIKFISLVNLIPVRETFGGNSSSCVRNCTRELLDEKLFWKPAFWRTKWKTTDKRPNLRITVQEKCFPFWKCRRYPERLSSRSVLSLRVPHFMRLRIAPDRRMPNDLSASWCSPRSRFSFCLINASGIRLDADLASAHSPRGAVELANTEWFIIWIFGRALCIEMRGCNINEPGCSGTAFFGCKEDVLFRGKKQSKTEDKFDLFQVIQGLCSLLFFEEVGITSKLCKRLGGR